MNLHLRRILLLVGLLALPLALSGCGVKGPLMPPQASGVVDAAEPDDEDQPGRVAAGPPAGSPRSGTNAPSVANAPNATKSSPLDWILN